MNTHTSIPQLFHSHDSQSLFTHCLCCDEPILETGNEYVIEKAYTRYSEYDVTDTVFEYAMCLDCLIKLQQQMSKASMQRVEAYFERSVDLENRLVGAKVDDKDVFSRLSSCVVKGTSVSELKEYQVIGLFRENQMLLGPFPYLLGGEAIDEISELLSNETLDEIDGFMDTHFGLPPELRKLFLDKPVMLI